MEVHPLKSVEPSAARGMPQSPAPSQSDGVFRRILDRILAASHPMPPPAKWARFGPNELVRRLSHTPSELLSQLTEQFTVDELLVARMVQRTTTGGLKIAPSADFDQAFLVRGEAPNRVADVVTQRGTLATGTAEWRDFATRTTDEIHNDKLSVVLCASDAELYGLSHFGILCTALAGIDKLTAADVRALFPNHPRHGQACLHQLVLLGWQPETLTNEPSAKNLAAIRHVANIQHVYSLEPRFMFSVWLPSAAELTRIRRAHSFVDRTILAAELTSSLRKSLHPPADALTLLADRQPATWSDARTNLESVIERSSLVPRVSEARQGLAKLEQAFRDEIMRPLEAAQGQTGLRALHSLASAEVAEQWFDNLALVQAARRMAVGQYPGDLKRLDDSAWQRKLKLVSAIVNLARVKF